MLIRSLRGFAKMTNREALSRAMDEEISRDPLVFLIGEEVAKYDGAYKISKGLWQKHGDGRVVDTPITQAGFTGLAIGAALMGLKPICEFMTWNFALQAIDHIVNSCAKVHHMSNGILGNQITFRGLNGPAASVAAQHSQCFAAAYANVPGLVVVTPFDAEDNYGLLKAAIRDPNPVVFLENQIMYSEAFEVNDSILHPDYAGPIGKAKVMRTGRHCTLVAYSRMVKVSLEAAALLESQGIECEVINLRTIKPLDRVAIIESVKKTGRLVSVEDGFPQHGVGAEIAALLFEGGAFDYLDAPMVRLTGRDVPMPYSRSLEEICTPRAPDVVKAVKSTLGK